MPSADRSSGIFKLGLFVLFVYLALLAVVLYGCYVILVGGMKITDSSIIAVVFTLIGSIVTGVTGLAGLVANYYYGSSHGSAVKNDILAGQSTAQKP